MAGHEVPGWLGFNPAELKATVMLFQPSTKCHLM